MTGDWILCVSQGFYCGSEGHYEDRGNIVKLLVNLLSIIYFIYMIEQQDIFGGFMEDLN